MRLKYRIAATIFVLQTVLVVAVAGTLLRVTDARFATQVAMTQNVHLEHLANLSRAALLTEDYAELQVFIEEATRGPLIEAVVVVDVFDKVVASTLPYLVGRPFTAFGRLEADEDHRRRAVDGYGQNLGAVLVRFTVAPFKSALQQALARTLWVAAFGIVASAVVALALGSWLAARLSAVARASTAVAEGRPFEVPAVAGASPEVRQLADAIKTMVRRLRAHAGELERARDRLILPTEAMAQGFALWDRGDRLVVCNGRMVALLGGEPEPLTEGVSFETYAHRVAALSIAGIGAEDLRRFRLQARSQGQTSFELALRSGRMIQIDESVTRDEGVVAIVTDVTERHRHAAALARNERRLERIMSCVLDGVLMVDRSARVLHANPAAERMIDRDLDVSESLDLTAIVRTWTPWPELLRNETTAPLLVEGEIESADGEARPIELALVSAGDDEPDLFIVGLRDISARKRAEAELRFAATHDRLTGVANHTEMQAQVDAAIEVAKRTDTSVALLFVDLDGFKLVNDTHGHVNGDRLLAAVAQRLRAAAGESAFVGRLGGDEFGVLIGAGEQRTVPAFVAATVLTAFCEPFEIDDLNIDVGARIGIALFPEHAADTTGLFRAADVALYQAKQAGGRRWRLFSQQDVARTRHRVAVAQHLERALDHGEIHLAYQPQYVIATGRLVGFEALVRWNSASFGAVPPDSFIPIAEETGLIVPLGAWILRQAVHDLRRLRAATGLPLRMSVNVSPRQIDERDFVRMVLDLVGDLGSGVAIELTERVLIDGVGRTRRHLDALGDAGLKMVLDDFGTGYSSLNHLRRFAIDEVKIDRSFIADVLDDPNDAQLVRGLIALCRDLRIMVTAEGVETAAQRDWLERYGCALGQGFLFARPAPFADALAVACHEVRTSGTRMVSHAAG